MDGEKVGRPPEEQWWSINGRDIMNALEEAARGTDPGIVYMELCANSEATDYGE